MTRVFAIVPSDDLATVGACLMTTSASVVGNWAHIPKSLSGALVGIPFESTDPIPSGLTVDTLSEWGQRLTSPDWDYPGRDGSQPPPWSAAPYAVLVPPDELTAAMASASLVQHVVWARYVVPMRVEDGANKCVLWYDAATKPPELEAYPRRYRSQVEALPVVEG